VKYAFIQPHQSTFRVMRMCQVFGVSRSGFYEWLNRPASARSQEDSRLGEQVKTAFRDSRETYGTRRLKHTLQNQGLQVSRARIARLMRERSLRCKTRRAFRATTDSRHDLPIAPNHLARQFEVGQPDRVYVSDISYIATAQGWLYLAIVLDLFSRQVVGWAMSAQMGGHAQNTIGRILRVLLIQ
jgi:transposase InsO family protein